jgi:hypothetical protein
MPAPPLFSMIVVHYQGTVPHDIFLRGVASLHAQTFTEYEILRYHDGPLLQPELAMSAGFASTSFTSTPTTFSYPDALEQIAEGHH